MRCSVALFASVVTLAAAVPVGAQEFKASADLFGQQKAAPKQQPKVDWNWRPGADQTSPAKPTVVCGMTLLPADPNVDSKMRVAAPDQRTTFTLRTVQPSVCTTR